MTKLKDRPVAKLNIKFIMPFSNVDYKSNFELITFASYGVSII